MGVLDRVFGVIVYYIASIENFLITPGSDSLTDQYYNYCCKICTQNYVLLTDIEYIILLFNFIFNGYNKLINYYKLLTIYY